MYTLGNKRYLNVQLLAVFPLLLMSCAKKLEVINSYGLIEAVYEGEVLPVSYGLPVNTPTHTVRFYIEGDGRAWLSKKQPSYNPTPSNSLVLKLMHLDDTPAVYLARPCQYNKNENCRQYYWTEGRHAEETVVSMNSAITNIKKNYNAEQVELIGHSGGGAMAVLIAARRSDVKRVITIAANLDVSFFTKHHNVTEMKGSLNPIDVIEKVKGIPQLHLVGGLDKIIPPKIVQRYIDKTTNNCMEYLEYPKNGHHTGWVDVWPQILNNNIACKK